MINIFLSGVYSRSKDSTQLLKIMEESFKEWRKEPSNGALSNQHDLEDMPKKSFSGLYMDKFKPF